MAGKRFMARRGQALIIWLVAKSAACHPVPCLNTQYDNGWEPDVWLWGRLGGRWGEGWLCVLFFSRISPSAASCSWFATVPVSQTVLLPNYPAGRIWPSESSIEPPESELLPDSIPSVVPDAVSVHEIESAGR